ncbi:hypothetical protein SprV_0702306500 [Sparganum proliferum]
MVSRPSTDAHFKFAGLSGTVDSGFASKTVIEDGALQPYVGTSSDWPVTVRGPMPGQVETSVYHAYSVDDRRRSGDNHSNSNTSFPPSSSDFVCKHEPTDMIDSSDATPSLTLPPSAPQIRFIFSTPSLTPMHVCASHDLETYRDSSAPLLEGDNLFAFDPKVIPSVSATVSALPSSDPANNIFYSPHSPSAFHRPTRVLVGDGDGPGGGGGFSPSSGARSPVPQTSLPRVRSANTHPSSLSPFPTTHHRQQQQQQQQAPNFDHPHQQQLQIEGGHLTATMDTQRLERCLVNTFSTDSLEGPGLVTQQQRLQPPPAAEAGSCSPNESAKTLRASVSLPGFTSPESAFYQYQNRMEGQLCQICGELAAGFHHGAYVCEACKVSCLS